MEKTVTENVTAEWGGRSFRAQVDPVYQVAVIPAKSIAADPDEHHDLGRFEDERKCSDGS